MPQVATGLRIPAQSLSSPKLLIADSAEVVEDMGLRAGSKRAVVKDFTPQSQIQLGWDITGAQHVSIAEPGEWLPRRGGERRARARGPVDRSPPTRHSEAPGDLPTKRTSPLCPGAPMERPPPAASTGAEPQEPPCLPPKPGASFRASVRRTPPGAFGNRFRCQSLPCRGGEEGAPPLRRRGYPRTPPGKKLK
ncbi:hypothetical protein NDU88_002677 [Pleurodeles waltl]|uniref:Uncharacterized protein n=1 Tax=Pleurodeles waltl TaxID=8319 RepID=A0AAV7NNU8_PLEWA|nr:hypothetical protein NDU88_002677 [Pleurodeles waltl]